MVWVTGNGFTLRCCAKIVEFLVTEEFSQFLVELNDFYERIQDLVQCISSTVHIREVSLPDLTNHRECWPQFGGSKAAAAVVRNSLRQEYMLEPDTSAHREIVPVGTKVLTEAVECRKSDVEIGLRSIGDSPVPAMSVTSLQPAPRCSRVRK